MKRYFYLFKMHLARNSDSNLVDVILYEKSMLILSKGTLLLITIKPVAQHVMIVSQKQRTFMELLLMSCCQGFQSHSWWTSHLHAPIALVDVTVCAARGLVLVLSTRLSRSWSQRSFTVQPAPRSNWRTGAQGQTLHQKYVSVTHCNHCSTYLIRLNNLK